jgi:hypothetical protein
LGEQVGQDLLIGQRLVGAVEQTEIHIGPQMVEHIRMTGPAGRLRQPVHPRRSRRHPLHRQVIAADVGRPIRVAPRHHLPAGQTDS